MKIMNTILALVALLALGVTSSAFAQSKTGKIGPAGCGLGNMVFGHKDMQVIAATVNGTSGNQTFAITTGSLGCEAGGRGMAMLNYIQNNKQSLEKDIARGQGDTLVALAQIAGCADEASLGTELKGRYTEIFPAADLSTVQITDSIKKVISESPALVTTCAPLS